ncbi:MAG: hypothetical protein C0594_14825 [Marinilabiliales bacterium]|nr:MAG: hypothetical protein C0594_14825 [Marinilabiliales bacterium]
MTSTEFENHPIYEKLNQLIDRLSQEEVISKIEVDKYNFYDSACKYINDRLKLTIPVLVPIAEMNTISTELQNALVQINNFLGNNNAGHLNNADNHFNAALTRIKNLPLPFSKNDFNFTKSIANFENTVKAKLGDVEKENQELKEQLKKIQTDLVAKQNEIKQISDLLTAKTNEITNLTSKFQTNYESIKSTASQNYENDRKTYRTEITTDRESFRKEITQDRETFKKEIEEKITKIDTDTSQIVSELGIKLEEAKKLVNVIGNVGVTGNYQNIANEHKTAANFWRYLAIAFMTVLSGLLIYAIWDVSSANYDWVKSLIRVIAAAALSYPATYAARESSKHRKLETINRKLELELASLTPFIELHSEEQKRDIKSKLVEKYFGNNIELTEDKSDKNEDLSIGGFEKIIKAILPFIKK